MKKRKLKVMNLLIALLTLIVIIIVISLLSSLLKKDFKVKVKNLTIETGVEFKNDFKATYKGVDVTRNVRVETDLDNKVAGIYEITYLYVKGDKEYKDVKKIKVIDTTKPNISLKGGNDIIVKLNSQFTEPGYVALDNSDGDITGNVVVTGEVDTSKEGVYLIKYYVADTSGNEIEVTRKITVMTSSPLEDDIQSFTLDGLFKKVTLKQTEVAPNEYLNKIIFIGDSMAYDYALNEQVSIENIWYQVSVTVDKALTSPIIVGGENTDKTFIENFERYKPQIVIIVLGTNSVSYMELGDFYEKYYEFVKKIKEVSPNTKIIIQSISPVDKKLDSTSMNNDKINKLNYYIGKMCNELDVKFLNSAKVLKNENGTCNEGYCKEDGYHLTKKGQEVLIEFIKTHMYN